MAVTLPNPSWLNGFSDSVKNLSSGGTANGLTGDQNLAAVYNGGVNPNKPVIPTPYIQGVLGRSASDTTSQSTYKTPADVNMPPTGGTVAPIVNTGGDSNNNTTSNWSTTPGQAMQSATEQAKARIDALLAGGKNAYNTGITSAKNAYDYQNQITGDSRTLRNSEFKNHNDPFSGNTNYLESNMLRNDSIQDTASNADYQNKVNQISQTWQDLQTAAPEQQQAIQDQLYQQAAALGIQADQLNLQAAGQKADYTGVYNGSPTLAAQGQQFNQGIAQAGLTGSYDGTPTLAAQGQAFTQNLQQKTFDNTVTQQQIQNGQWSKTFDTQMQQWAATNKLDWAKMSQDTKIQLAQLAVSQQNANTSAAGQANTATNDAARLAWDKDPTNPANMYKNSQIDLASARTELLNNPKSPQSISYMGSLVAQLNKTYSEIDPITGANKGVTAANKPALRQSIVDMKLPKSAEDQLMGSFGLQPTTVSDSDISSYLNK